MIPIVAPEVLSGETSEVRRPRYGAFAVLVHPPGRHQGAETRLSREVAGRVSTVIISTIPMIR